MSLEEKMGGLEIAKKKKKKKVVIDGKEYDESDFAEGHYWTKNKK